MKIIKIKLIKVSKKEEIKKIITRNKENLNNINVGILTKIEQIVPLIKEVLDVILLK